MGKRKKRRPAAKRSGSKAARSTADEPRTASRPAEADATAAGSLWEQFHRPDRRGAALAFGVAVVSGAMWVLAAPRFLGLVPDASRERASAAYFGTLEPSTHARMTNLRGAASAAVEALNIAESTINIWAGTESDGPRAYRDGQPVA